MTEKALILDDKAMGRAINRISYEIIERSKGTDGLCIIGILSRGKELADRIAGKILQVEGKSVPVGYLDITPSATTAAKAAARPPSPSTSAGRRSCWWMTSSTPAAASGQPSTR